ncbi:MAG: UpxY family transcription antiterminator [Bacteroidales bacterium]
MANWLALYVRSRFEKKVSDSLTKEGIENYLPLQKTLRQWKDRKKWVYVPLFNSYVFVKPNPNTYYNCLKINGVVKFVWFDGKPAIIKDEEIALIKSICNSSYSYHSIEFPIQIGQKVKIVRGTFRGYEGEVIQLNGKHKVLFRISNLPISMVVEIPKNYLQVL